MTHIFGNLMSIHKPLPIYMRRQRDAQDRKRRRTHLVLGSIVAILALSLLAPYAAADVEEDRYSGPRYWEFHAAIMGVAGLLFVLALTTSLLRLLSVEWRVKAHIVIGSLAIGLAMAGIAFSVWLVERRGHTHFSLTHSVAGGVTLVILLVLLASGILLARSKEERSGIPWLHVILSIGAIVAVVIAGATGANLAW
jgi:hypothetical protein